MVGVGRAEAAVRFMPLGGIRQRSKPNATFALEQFVLVVQAVQLAVHQPDLLRRFQPDALQRLLVAGNHPRRGAGELELQRLAYVRVQIHDVLVLSKPLAVGRVNQHQCTVSSLGSFSVSGLLSLSGAVYFLYPDLSDVNVLLHAGGTYVLHRGL